jgi:hypothetical protein
VLDQVTDTDTVERPKPAVKSSEASDTVRHLNQTDLEQYSSGRLPAARLDFCRTHLDSCDACRAELEDVRTYQRSALGIQRTEPAQRVPDRRKRRRSPAVPLLAAATLALMAGVCSVLWFHHKKLSANRTPPVASVPVPSAATPPTASAQTDATHIASALPAARKPTESPATQHGKPQPTMEMNRPRARVSPEAQTGFALVSPLGKTTLETRPEFTWQPLPGAIGYTVEIVDPGLHPVLHSPGLKGTSWRPKHPLRPGETYFWQVTATLHGGAKVAASEPSLSATTLKIAVPKLADDMEHFKQGHRDDHLVLAAMYAQSGMAADSAAELKKISRGEPGYNMAQAMLKSLPALEPPPAQSP